MVTQAVQGLWLEAASDLRGRLGSDRYERWVAPLSLLEAEAEEVRLGAPNKFWVEWIETSYLQDIAGVLARRLGRPVRVTVGIDPFLFQNLRRTQREILQSLSHPESAESTATDPSLGQSAPLHSGPEPGFPPPPEPQRRGPCSAELQTLQSFVVGSSNCLAHNAALQVAEAPGSFYNPLLFHGSSGLGKTHLLRGILREIKRRWPSVEVRYLTGEDFLNRFLQSLKAGTTGRFRDHHRAPQVMIVDDIHLLGSKTRTQEEFLHTFDTLSGAGHQIVLASDCHPRSIGKLDRSLLGRLLSGLVVKLARPDFETRLLILQRKARQARIPFTEEVLSLLARVSRGNVRELIGAFNLLEAHSFQQGRPLDPARAQKVLAEEAVVEERRLSVAGIADRVARHFGVPVSELCAPSRQRSTVRVRQVAMFLGRKYTAKSLAEIGQFFGNRNHTSVTSACAKVEGLLRSNPALAKDVEIIIDSLEE